MNVLLVVLSVIIVFGLVGGRLDWWLELLYVVWECVWIFVRWF